MSKSDYHTVARPREVVLQIRDDGIWFRNWHTIRLDGTGKPPVAAQPPQPASPYRSAPMEVVRVPQSVEDIVNFDECHLERCFNMRERFIPWAVVEFFEIVGNLGRYDHLVKMEHQDANLHQRPVSLKQLKSALIRQEQDFRMFLSVFLRKRVEPVDVSVPLKEEEAQQVMQECIKRFDAYQAKTMLIQPHSTPSYSGPR